MGLRLARKPFSSRALLALPLLILGAADCYSTGDGTPPPLDQLYYPVGLQVSAGGSVLYAVNSDFDLQYNGGTLQSYDLGLIRQHAVKLIADPSAREIPLVDESRRYTGDDCREGSARLTTLGETCAPPVKSDFYVRDSAVIGAFATDLLLSRPPASLESSTLPDPSTPANDAGNRAFDRLFMAVRGNASVTWASVERDTVGAVLPSDPKTYGPFRFRCGQDSEGRCDGNHQAGSNPDEPGNTRHITMPGEPFGMAMSQDGRAIVITHQNETKTSLFDTGLRRTDGTGPGNPPSRDDDARKPSLQFVLEQVPIGGVAVAAIPHDRDAFVDRTSPYPQAFLETSRAAPQVSLLRQYPDELPDVNSKQRTESNQLRPFLDLEGGYGVVVGPGGTDSRGIVIDPTPRLACKAKVKKNLGLTKAESAAQILACARKPARVFIANRTPASMLIGELGGSTTAENNFDPDRLLLHATIPLSAGPSKLYLAPVVEADGALALRVFAVCFDSATIFVYNPDTEQVENVIRTGLGPFAMAFDPFSFEDVAENNIVESADGIRRYRFGYLASFTNSFIQVLDLDNGGRSPTFERVVFTLGQPTNPKGS